MKIKNIILAAAVTAAMGTTGNAFAHAGIFASQTVGDVAENTGLGFAADGTTVVKDTSVSATGFLEGTSPLIGATIGHTCGHEEPYPDESDIGLVLPVGGDSVILKAKTVSDSSSAYKMAKASLTFDSLVDSSSPVYKVSTDTNTAYSFVVGSVKFAGANVTTAGTPRLSNGTVWSDGLFNSDQKALDHLGNPVDPSKYAKINSGIWTGTVFGQEYYGVANFRATLPKFPSKTAVAGTPGRCATQMKIAVPISQVCSKATSGQLASGAHKMMNWQLAPVPGFDWSVMGEVAKIQSPYITVNRNMAANPRAADCPALAISDNAAETSTLYVAPSAAAQSTAFGKIAAKARIKVDSCASGSAAAKHNCL